MTINYISLCSGYGAECLAFRRLRRDHPEAFGFNLLAWAEIEPYACAAHDALHADADRNLGDITAVDWKQWHESIGNPHVDLLFASTPCQSVSTAGKQEGMKKGTDAASALIWATEQCIATLLPDFIIYENVKGLISKRNMPDFMEFCATIEKYGYRHMYKVFNAKDFGVPQNRERVFPIFYRDPEWQYAYPEPFSLVKRLRDVLEENVDESYYLSDEQVRRILAHCDRKQETDGVIRMGSVNSSQDGVVVHPDGISPCHVCGHGNTPKIVETINTTKDGCASTITAHYHKCGASDFRPHGVDGNQMSNTAVLEVTEVPRVIQVGNLVPEAEWKYSNPQRGRVYDPQRNSPCIDNMGGGDREPKIMQIGSYSPSSQCNAKVLDTDGICPALLDHKGAEPAILTPIRTKVQRQLRKQGIDTFGGRQLLPRTDGVSNTLTSVTKDNLLQEPVSCAMRGRGEGWKQQLEFGGRVANSLTSVQTDSLVAEPIKIRQATAQGYIECPVGGGFDAAYPSSKLRRGRVQDNGDVIGAITAQGDAHCVYEGAEVIGSMQANAMRGSIDGISPCLTSAMGEGGGQIPMATEPMIQPLIPWNRPGNATVICPTITSGGAWEHNNVVIEPQLALRYRIRKLTPTECFRLMGMDDADIDKIEAYRVKTVLKSGKVKEKPIPKTAKYKLAGNSIVVDVLYHLFRNMFIPDYSAQPKRHEPSLADFW